MKLNYFSFWVPTDGHPPAVFSVPPPCDVMEPLAFLAFNRRVRRALLASLGELPPDDFLADVGISFGSLRNTLFHVMRVEDFWVHVFLQGGEATLPREARDALDAPAALADRWEALSNRTEGYVRGLDAATLGEVRPRRRGDAIVEKTVEEYLFTFLIHEVYHKGEVLAALWQRDFEPPPVDYWRY